MNYFEILIESKTNLKVTYKDNDQSSLKKIK